MSSIPISQIRPGTKIIPPFEKGVIGFLKNDIKERTILGRPVGEWLPVKVRDFNGNSKNGHEYLIVNKSHIESIAKPSCIHTDDYDSPDVLDENLIRLWAFTPIWERSENNGDYPLKKDLKFWLNFDSREKLQTITLEGPYLSIDIPYNVEINTNKDYSFSVTNPLNLPPSFNKLLNTFNNLLEQLKEEITNHFHLG